MYINIHSHRPVQKGEWTIQNLYRNFSQTDPSGSYSMGLHPWYIREETWLQEWETLKQNSLGKTCIAIGECGLDKLCDTPYALQEEVCSTQLLWANEIRKPVIIHCVKGFTEMLALIRKTGISVPCIFHGFNKKPQTADQIIKDGHYISFGKAILHKKMQEVISSVPTDRIFFETDDADIPVSEIYKSAATATGIQEESLILQIRKNLETVFHITV